MAKSGNTTQDIRLSVRLTPEERLELARRADGVPLSSYVRSELLGKRAGRGSRKPDQRAIAQVLALLGQSDAFVSLQSLAASAELGALPDDAEAIAAIHEARDDLAAIKSLLMMALRIAVILIRVCQQEDHNRDPTDQADEDT